MKQALETSLGGKPFSKQQVNYDMNIGDCFLYCMTEVKLSPKMLDLYLVWCN